MTTVEELIDFLTQFPPDAPVTYSLHSEVKDLELNEIQFVKADEKRLCRHHNMVDWYMYQPFTPPADPQWVTAVVLPGN